MPSARPPRPTDTAQDMGDRPGPQRPPRPTETAQAQADRPDPRRPPRPKDAAQAYGDRPGPRTLPRLTETAQAHGHGRTRRTAPGMSRRSAQTLLPPSNRRIHSTSSRTSKVPPRRPLLWLARLSKRLLWPSRLHASIARSAPSRIQGTCQRRDRAAVRSGSPWLHLALMQRGRSSKLPRGRATWRPAFSAPAAAGCPCMQATPAGDRPCNPGM